MILILDASAALDLLLRNQAGDRVRAALNVEADVTLVTVAHLDAEVFSGLARLYRAGDLRDDEVVPLLDRLGSLPMQRAPVTTDLMHAAWRLRHNVAARDALYVATAQRLGGRLATTDDGLARAVPELAVPVNGP